MSFDEQRGDSDPLPYTQVDRAVKPKAALLASLMGTTPQHALGALVEFWDLNGDPRELERLVAQGKREVVLTPEATRIRFRLASGKDMSPEDLEMLGLLERRPEGYRVRGMSRYFKPVETRLKAREAGRAGGLASARARKESLGTAQPRSGDRSEVASGVLRESLRERFESASEVASGVLEQQSKPTEPADSGQRSYLKEDVRAHVPDEPKKQARPTTRRPSAAQDFFAAAQALACERLAGRAPESPPPPAVLNSQLKAALTEVGRRGLDAAWVVFLADEGARLAGYPWGWFAAQWPRHYNATRAPQKQPEPVRWEDEPCEPV